MNAPPDETSRGWSPMVIGGVIVGGLLLLLLIPTFRAPAPQVDSPENGTATDEDVSETQCERTLMSAVDGLQPNRLGISSESRVMVDTLNNWAAQCVDPSTRIVDPADPQLREQLLAPAGSVSSQSDRFQLRDAEHIRNTLLAADIVERITADLRSDEQRALALFYYVVRTLDLVPDDAPELLLTPYESLVYGVGTAADRAWTYALLMRQLRLDVVMIQPRGRDETMYWLLGAVIPGEGVRLLDPRMGLPISPAGELSDPQSPLPEEAASLAEVRQNEQLLRQYDQGDRKYPLTGEDLQTVDVYAIGTSSTFAPRMGRLQAALPDVGEVYDGLSSNELREVGLVDRLVAAGADGLWTAEQVHVWPYPEQYWSDTSERTDEQKQRLAGMQSVIRGPLAISITVSVNDQGELQLGTAVEPPQRTLLEARIEQLLGNFGNAQQAYLQTRLNQVNLSEVQMYFKSVRETLAEQMENPQEAQQTYQAIEQSVAQEINRLLQNVPERQINAFAADMATYWAAQIHYEQQDFRLAAENAQAYLNRGAGNFLMSAIYLTSLSLAQDGRPKEAVELAAQRPAEAPGSLGYLALVERWRKLSGEPQAGDKPATESDAQKKSAEQSPKPESQSEAKPEAGSATEPEAKPASQSDNPPAGEKDAAAEPASASEVEQNPASQPQDATEGQPPAGDSAPEEGGTDEPPADSAPSPEAAPAADRS